MKSDVSLSCKRQSDKIDRSMTRGKLLDINTTLFILYFYSNDDPRDPENRLQNRFSERRFLEKKTSYDRLNGEAWLTAVALLSANNTTLVSVDESSHIRMYDYISLPNNFRMNILHGNWESNSNCTNDILCLRNWKFNA